MSPEQIVEATLFSSQTPLTPDELARADEDLTPDRVREALSDLRRRYDEEERAFQLYQLGDGFQLLTRPEYAPYLERFDSVPRSPTLSDAALETLAIVAYRQPIGRVEIEEIRGVGSSSVLRTLQEWELVEVVGRGDGLGRPLLYGTSQRFLDHFGFQSLADLPASEEIPVSLREEPVDAEDVEEGTPAAEDPAAEPGPEGEDDEGRGAADAEEDEGPSVDEAVRRIREDAAAEDAENGAREAATGAATDGAVDGEPAESDG